MIEDGLGNITVRKNKKTLPVESWIFDTADGDDLERCKVPEGRCPRSVTSCACTPTPSLTS